MRCDHHIRDDSPLPSTAAATTSSCRSTSHARHPAATSTTPSGRHPHTSFHPSSPRPPRPPSLALPLHLSLLLLLLTVLALLTPSDACYGNIILIPSVTLCNKPLPTTPNLITTQCRVNAGSFSSKLFSCKEAYGPDCYQGQVTLGHTRSHY